MADVIRPPSEDDGYRTGSVIKAAILSQRRHQTARYVFLARALVVLLAGYLLFDRTFAWIHVPGTPIFIGEVVLATGVYVAFRSKEALRFVRLSPPIQALLVFMAFGTLLTVIAATGDYDIRDVARDAAIWYYGLFAIVIGSLARAWEPAYDFFLRSYTRIIPVFLVVGVFRLLMANAETGLVIPDSEVLLTAHKPGNLGVQAALLVAFLLLVIAPELERRDKVRNVLLTVGGLLLMAMAGTQNRGSLVAGFVALALIYFAGRTARPFMAGILVVLLSTIVLAFSFNLRFDLERRTVSVDQLFSNLLSLDFQADEDGTNEDDGTVAWRLELWKLVMEDTLSANRFLSGFGFGPNLASKYDFFAGAEEGPELRNPHNSHLSVIARMGLLGAALWVVLWATWFRHLWKARKRFLFAGEDQRAGFLAWCMVAATAVLINGIFDPSLEGPQAAVWIWCIFGLGAFVAVEGNVVRWRRRTPGWSRQNEAV